MSSYRGGSIECPCRVLIDADGLFVPSCTAWWAAVSWSECVGGMSLFLYNSILVCIQCVCVSKPVKQSVAIWFALILTVWVLWCLLDYQLWIVIVYANKLIPFVLVLLMRANVLRWTGWTGWTEPYLVCMLYMRSTREAVISENEVPLLDCQSHLLPYLAQVCCIVVLLWWQAAILLDSGHQLCFYWFRECLPLWLMTADIGFWMGLWFHHWKYPIVCVIFQMYSMY